jgi:eukaryotic-like serine/threonine-protein kinase
VHGDIKPSNILEASGKWKLADFGFAAQIGSGSPTGGTPAYMSPEALGRSTAAASDMYAFGMTLLALFTSGRFPPRERDRHATTVTDLVRAVTNPVPSVPDDVPEPWMHLIRRLTSANPSERPTPSEVMTWCDGVAKRAEH